VLTLRAESGPLSAVLPPILAFTLGILGVGALAEALARRTERDELQRQTDTRMIEELTPTVADTAAMKWEHARRALREELARGRRYGHKVTLTLVGVDDWEEYVEQRGAEAARETQTRLASVLESTVRPTDKVAYRQAGEIAVIFPHTDVRGAQRAVERIRQIIRNALELEVRAGVAEFPEDAVDVDGLVREADFALAFARQSGLFVASRSLLDRA
jgi:diguanylate cyclase (GGDEF)-like protein